MTILVDMDDTMEQLLRAWLQAVNEKYGTNVTYEQSLVWDVSAAFPGLTHKQVYDVPLEKDFWKRVEPMPGAAQALQRFMQAGHKVFIVTAADYETVPEKMQDHLFKHFPFLSWNQVIITSNKQLIRGDVLIDDGIHNLEGGDYAKILMTAPYNEWYDAEANGMIRVHNWQEVEEAVRRIEKTFAEKEKV